MSRARANFVNEVDALASAVSSPGVSKAAGLDIDPGTNVLRRGAAIAGLVMLETFIRERTEEVLREMQRWPAAYEDLPQSFRSRATIEALPHLEKYARMLKRQDDDFENEVISEARRISQMCPPSFEFTKFIAGDFTGNLSDSNLRDLLKVFQIKDCWNSLQRFSADVGFGVPSVHEVVRDVVRNRHRSAHSANFNPTASDMIDLPQNIRLVGMGVDAALSAASRAAVNNWRVWADDAFDWRRYLLIFKVLPDRSRFRILRSGTTRALRIVGTKNEVRTALPTTRSEISKVVVYLASDGRPLAWDIA